ncbi:MAG: glyoxalase superfamily protein [Pseudomonadota bacterium]
MTFTREPKLMAKKLRSALVGHDIDLSHSQCLEIVAQQHGFKDWNTAAAAIETHAAKPLPQLVLPHGWKVSGTQARDYSIGLDDSDATGAATIRALDKDAPHVGFATLMQSVVAAPFAGQRLRLRAELKTQDAPDAATIWMRMDDASGQTVAFDNMEKRTVDGVLSGTADWSSREVVLDVPSAAESIHYGFYLRGAGQCWARSFALDAVGDEIAPTGKGKGHLDMPTNLSFAQAH